MSEAPGSAVSSVRCYVSVNSWATICYVSSVSSVLTGALVTCYLEHRQERAGEWPGEKRGSSHVKSIMRT